jgi:hypothetical protein
VPGERDSKSEHIVKLADFARDVDTGIEYDIESMESGNTELEGKGESKF